MALILSKPQYIFLNGLETKFRAYVGGFGSGKTYVGCLDLLLFAMKNRNISQGYFGPTYSSIKDIFWPTIDEAAFSLGLSVVIKRGDKEVFIHRNGFPIGHIICRSMDRPESIVGFKIARALVDELDTMPMDKAKQAWNKIIARMRLVIPGIMNSVGVTCTPEGYTFVYNQFGKKPTARYSMVQASTYENAEFLPEDYIESLIETYSEQLAMAYIEGEFVNLTAGSVYPEFDKTRCNTHYVEAPQEPLHIGMDFNVYNMTSIIHVERKGIPYAVNELTGVRDTPAMIEVITEKYPDRDITIYPDATGKSVSSKGASLSDIGLLKNAGFPIKAKDSNPYIRDRVISMNNAFAKGKYYVNVERCPVYTEALEKQAYDKNGMPDKSSGLDHPVDAGGYYITFNWPVIRPSIRMAKLQGV